MRRGMDVWGTRSRVCSVVIKEAVIRCEHFAVLGGEVVVSKVFLLSVSDTRLSILFLGDSVAALFEVEDSK